MSESKKRKRKRKGTSKKKEQEEDELEIKRTSKGNSSSHYTDRDNLIPTGLSELNLMASGNVHGGLPPGSMVHIVGNSDAGKTILTTSSLAEVAHNPNFDHYDIVHIPTEGGFGFNVEYMFGSKLEERLNVHQLPTYEKKMKIPGSSKKRAYEFMKTVEGMCMEVCRIMRQAPSVIVLDSIEGLSCEHWRAVEIEEELHDNFDTGGSMGMEKAKALHGALSTIKNVAIETGSVFYYISQAKDKKIDFGFASGLNYSGGRAPKFFADIQLGITSGGKDFKKTIKGVEHIIGSQTKVKVTKNHINGKKGVIFFRILHNYGIDDIYGVIYYLLTNRWTGKKTARDPKEIKCNIKTQRGASDKEQDRVALELLEWAEENNKEKRLRVIMQKTFHEIEEDLTPKRKRRF